MPAGEGRERGRTSQLDPSDKAIGRAQPPSPPTLSREGRGSQKLFRHSALLQIQRYWDSPFEGPALRFRSRWLEGLAVRKRGGPGRATPRRRPGQS